MMIRLFKTAQLLGEEEGAVIKSIAEITTTLMRMEQSRKNGGLDEIRFEKAIARIGKLHLAVKKRTDYKLMKIALKSWMKGILLALDVAFRKHEKRIHLGGKW